MSHNKKVLIVMPSMKIGGAEKSLVSLLNRLTPEIQEENGISLDLMVVNTNGELYASIPKYINLVDSPDDFRIYITQLKELISTGNWTVKGLFHKLQWQIIKKITSNPDGLSENDLYWTKMSKYINKFSRSYDIAISYMNGAASYYVIDKVEAKKKYIWVHNQLEKLNVNRKFLKVFFEKADGIVTISDLCVNSIVKSYPEFKDKIYSIPNLSDEIEIKRKAEAFYPDEYKEISMPIILSIGRLVHQKGFDIGIEAAKILTQNNINFVWFIMGEGKLKSQLQQQIVDSQLEDRIILLSVRDNPYPYMKNCDIVFQPSRYEGKSIVLDEAKILLKPIVTSDYDTVHDQIQSNITGVIAKLNPQDLARALEMVIEDSELSRKLSRNLEISMRNRSDEFKLYLNFIKGLA